MRFDIPRVMDSVAQLFELADKLATIKYVLRVKCDASVLERYEPWSVV